MSSNPRPIATIPRLGALYRRFADWGWPLVRVAAGAPLIPHGVQKSAGLFGADLGRPAGFVEGDDAPFGARIAAALIAGFMLASVAVHWPAGFYWTDRGFEYPLVLLLLALAPMIRGGGERSVDRKLGVEI